MKKKKPETIADLKINMIFMRESLTHDYFINEFKTRNPKLPNYKIKSNTYTFHFVNHDKIIPFKIFVFDKGFGLYENTLFDLMSQLYRDVSTYLFDNKISTVFELKKFVTSSKSTHFNINCEIILL